MKTITLQKWLMALVVMHMPVSIMAASTGLSIEEFDIKAGETKEMVIDLNNPSDEITLVQFDLRLPNGLSLLASSSNTLISGTEGAIIKMTLVADGNFQSGTITLENILLVTPDEKEIKPAAYEYKLSSLDLQPFVYFIGSTSGWADADQKLALQNNEGLYTGFLYVADPNGWGLELKFQLVQGSWGEQLNSNNLDEISGGFAKGSDNIIAVDGEGVYYVTLNLITKKLHAVKIETMGIVGDFNGWGSDVKMTWNAADYCFEARSVEISSNGWKFRVNRDWAINLGGESLDNLVADGANLTTVGTTVRLYPTRKTSDYIYCTVSDDAAHLSIEPFSIKAGETKEMFVDLTNPEDEITLVQFDLRLPNGLTLKQTGGEYDIDMCDRTTWRRHSLDANATDGIIRFLLASSSNTVISGTSGAIIKMTLTAGSNYSGDEIWLENILLVTPDEKEIKPEPASTSGINDVKIDNNTHNVIYSLSGQRLTAPKKGINIVGGRKVVVK